jgi:hypothetical protein
MRFPTLSSLVRGAVVTAMAGVVLLAAGSLHARSASAFDVWCYDDPIIMYDGMPQSITVGMAQSSVGHLTGPVAIVVQAPAGHTVTLGPDQSGPFKVVTQIVEGGGDNGRGPVIRLATLVPGDSSFDVTVTTVDSFGVTNVTPGRSNRLITSTFNPKAGSGTADKPGNGDSR